MLELKKIILYSILPALIAGFFAIAPKIYDVATEPKAQLSYSVIQGPLLEIDGLYKSIVSIQVENTGKKILSGVEALIITNATIDALNLNKTAGLEPRVSSNEGTKISLNKMHPNDYFTLSLMLSSKKEVMTPSISLRSNEVLGNLSIRKQADSALGSILSGFSAAISVFLMSIALIMKLTSGSSFSIFDERTHTLFYISAKLGLSNIVESIGMSEKRITYLRFADQLFYLAKFDKEKKTSCIRALKALLLIKEIASSSRKQIERHLRLLEGEHFNSQEIDKIKKDSRKIRDAISLRNEIDSIIEFVEIT
ncbi:TPA: hypothetical protein P2I06_003162 [Aeromonas veronii]|nr:hypothetical protein [Aeromonas veronii]